MAVPTQQSYISPSCHNNPQCIKKKSNTAKPGRNYTKRQLTETKLNLSQLRSRRSPFYITKSLQKVIPRQ